MKEEPENTFLKTNEALKDWRQGDCVLGDFGFVYRFDPEAPITIDANTNLDEGDDIDLVEAVVEGLMVVSQTCDIVRNCKERPFLEVCPLVEVEPSNLKEIERCRRPQYAYVPGVSNHNLVADLDRIMTIEKGMILKWKRIVGCCTDIEFRNLSQALARKRLRVAFPDDFVKLAGKLQVRIKEKHDKNSDEGRDLRSLREIRVQAAPSWDAESVEIMLYFIRESGSEALSDWSEQLEKWKNMIPPCGRFKEVNGIVTTLADLTAQDYVSSDPLDLDHLSEN